MNWGGAGGAAGSYQMIDKLDAWLWLISGGNG
jgi:hypothetical protein